MVGKRVFTLLVVLLTASCIVNADTVYTFTPDSGDLNDLDHYRAYVWGIDVPLDQGETAIAASLTFHQIRNWNNNANILYNHLLDWTELGEQEIVDNQGGGDYFETAFIGPHSHLVTYENLTTEPLDLVYEFTQNDLASLNAYLADGRIGLGFDPDCHFYNTGVDFTLTTPEPGSLGLLVSGMFLLLRRGKA